MIVLLFVLANQAAANPAGAVFVGNQACAPCHAGIFRSYLATPMAQSSGSAAGRVPAGSFRHAASGIEYRMDGAGGVRMLKGPESAQRQLQYFIGSGAAGRSYLYARDGFLFQAPVTWYAQKPGWDASPGFENDRASRWSRPVEPSCLYCHASQVRHVPGTQNKYLGPPFSQDGVGCERCHGPGSEHARGRAKMVNPAKLEPARRDAICAQCHLSGEARSERAGRRIFDYRSGELLSQYVAYFVFPDRQAALKATSHVEKFSASRCKQASGDRLWCGTCHDPHAVPAADQRASWYRAKCLGCHKPADCARGQDCAACHMPKGRVTDGGHGVLTDHSIPRAARLASELPAAWRLVGFSPADAGDREIGLAYAEMFLRTGDRRQQDEAIRLLERVAKDPDAQARLAHLYQGQADPARAEALYRAVLDRAPHNAVALVNLGAILGSRNRLDEAIQLWRRALATNPCLAEAWQNLIIALRAQKNDSAAEAVYHARSFCEFGGQ